MGDYGDALKWFTDAIRAHRNVRLPKNDDLTTDYKPDAVLHVSVVTRAGDVIVAKHSKTGWMAAIENVPAATSKMYCFDQPTLERLQQRCAEVTSATQQAILARVVTLVQEIDTLLQEHHDA